MPYPTTDGAATVETISLQDESLTHDLLVLRARVAECLVRGHGSITVDVTSLRRVSSETVAALLWARRKCSASAIPFTVCGAGTRTSLVLHRCGLQETRPMGSS